MLIALGVNGSSATPLSAWPERQLVNDGSAALVADGKIVCATIEERHTKSRYDSGFRHSARICLAGMTARDIDLIAFSTCCGYRFTEREATEEVLDSLGSTFSRTRVVVVPHHESHAMLAFVGSRFDRALVAVLDGMGNRKTAVADPWWRGPFERQSYYMASWEDGFVHLELVDEDATGPDEVGIGEVYRAMTHYSGFESYEHAGKTMALAALGNPERVSASIIFIEYRDGKIWSPMQNYHDDPIRQVRDLFTDKAEIPEPACPAGSRNLPPQPLRDLVAVLQEQVENALVGKITALCSRLGIRHVCLSGGVALNCLAIGELVRRNPELEVYIPPAPGDSGQGLGNAIWAACSEATGSPQDAVRLRACGIVDAGLGPQYLNKVWEQAAMQMRGWIGVSLEGPYRPRDLARAIANSVLKGKVVAIRYGRAEYGPRALGYSSVIADPRIKEMPERVNRFKKREHYRPFAPSVLAEHQSDYFDLSAQSPFMSIAGRVVEHRKKGLPAVVHADGTARYQTVAADGPRLLRNVIEEFLQMGGVPLVLNTSFNTAGAPIVETPAQAVEMFYGSSLDVLCVGQYLAFKHEN